MDAQLKRGMIEVCILSVLTRGDSYGYQLIKDIEPIMALSESTLYPVLRRLEAADCLSVYSVEHNSRLRKYYHITNKGEQRVQDFMGEWNDIMKLYNYIKEGQENNYE